MLWYQQLVLSMTISDDSACHCLDCLSCALHASKKLLQRVNQWSTVRCSKQKVSRCENHFCPVGPVSIIRRRDLVHSSETSVVSVQGYCVPGCAEDVIGMTFYRYILTNVVSINGVDLVSALGKKCLHMASHVEAPWVSPQYWSISML